MHGMTFEGRIRKLSDKFRKYLAWGGGITPGLAKFPPPSGKSHATPLIRTAPSVDVLATAPAAAARLAPGGG